MSEKKEWRGLTINMCVFQGKLVENPVIVPMGNDKKCAFMKLRTFVDELCQNGQWTTNPMVIPLVVLDQKKINVVEKYVEKERELLVNAYYKEWTSNGEKNHGMVVTLMKLGSKGIKKSDDIPSLPEA